MMRKTDNLVEAGEALNRLRAAIKAMPEGRRKETAFEKSDRLQARIRRTPALTLADAAVKLRLLADPSLGIEMVNDDALALRQVLALVERSSPAHSRKGA